MKTYGKSQIMRRLSRRLFLEETLLTAAAVSTGLSRVPAENEIYGRE